MALEDLTPTWWLSRRPPILEFSSRVACVLSSASVFGREVLILVVLVGL